MQILPTQTQSETYKAKHIARVLRVVEAMHHLATTLKITNTEFWGSSDDEILTVLNDDVSRTLQTFQANTEVGTLINSFLDVIGKPEFSNRALVEPVRSDVVFNGELGVFEILLPEVVEEVIISESEII
jgi:hypothetical protein